MNDVDLDSYGDPNDLASDDPAPREPRGEPEHQTDEFDVWQFDTEASATVQDTYVVDRNPHPLDFRMWVFQGRGEVARFVMRASHKYGRNEVVPDMADDCCEVLFDGQSLRERHCPESVKTTVQELTGAELEFPNGDDEHGGPINY